MTEAWSVRVKRIMHALGWKRELMARELGLVHPDGVTRILNGGRPRVEVLLRLQQIETRYAAEIEAGRKPGGDMRKAFIWPPMWVECNKRRWIGGPESSPPSRPADLAALGSGGTDAEAVLTGWLEPGLYPGRVLRVIDFTLEARRRYAQDRKDAAGERDATKRGRSRAVGAIHHGGKE